MESETFLSHPLLSVVSLSRTFLSILDERASMVRVAYRCLMFAAVDINTLPKLGVGEHTDAFYKS